MDNPKDYIYSGARASYDGHQGNPVPAHTTHYDSTLGGILFISQPNMKECPLCNYITLVVHLCALPMVSMHSSDRGVYFLNIFEPRRRSTMPNLLGWGFSNYCTINPALLSSSERYSNYQTEVFSKIWACTELHLIRLWAPCRAIYSITLNPMVTPESIDLKLCIPHLMSSNFLIWNVWISAKHEP